MVTVSALTAARMLAIEAASVVDGAVVGDDLILERFDASTINAGNVRGPAGTNGTNGADGTNGATPTMRATSTTSRTVGTGSRQFTVPAMSVAFPVGAVVRASGATPTNYMTGIVTASTTTSVTIDATEFGGSGTLASWVLTIAAFTPSFPATPSWYGSSAEAPKTNSGWNSHTVTPTVDSTTDVANAYFTPVSGGMQFNQTGLYLVNANCSFSASAADIRVGFGFFTTGSIVPLVSAGGNLFGGSLFIVGTGTNAMFLPASALVRVTGAGAQVRMQNFFSSTGSRVATVDHLVVTRLANI